MDVIGLTAALARQPLRLARLAVDAVETVYRTVTDQPGPGPQPPQHRGPARPPAATSPPPPVVTPPPPVVTPPRSPGPEIHVEEPFDGYSLLKAGDVIARLSGATAEEAAAIELYEGTTKGRATVIRAAAMRLEKLRARPRA